MYHLCSDSIVHQRKMSFCPHSVWLWCTSSLSRVETSSCRSWIASLFWWLWSLTVTEILTCLGWILTRIGWILTCLECILLSRLGWILTRLGWKASALWITHAAHWAYINSQMYSSQELGAFNVVPSWRHATFHVSGASIHMLVNFFEESKGNMLGWHQGHKHTHYLV